MFYHRGLLVVVSLLLFYFLLLPSSSAPSPPVPPLRPPRGAHKAKKPAPKPSPKWQMEKVKAQQRPLQEMETRPLREQLEYQFPYDVHDKFPAYIWQTWKYTPSSPYFSEDFRKAEASWTQKHPEFVHEVITDMVAEPLLRHLYAAVPDVMEAYRALPKPILKADFFRYLVLLARGGIYSDIDTFALKPAHEWIPEKVDRSSYGLVIGIEADPDRPDWHDWFPRRIQFCQWTIQSKPGHPVLLEIVASITEEILRRKKKGKLNIPRNDIMEFTGPARWTDTIFHYLNNPRYFDMTSSKGNVTVEAFFNIVSPRKIGDVIVLPITSFSPGIKTMNAQGENDPMAFVLHLFDGSWKPEYERHIGDTDDVEPSQTA